MLRRRLRIPHIEAHRPCFVGLDVSLTGTGLVVLDHERDIVGQKLIRTTPKDHEFDRQQGITETVIRELRAATALATVCYVVIEGYAFSRNTGRHFTRAEIVGMLKRELAALGFGVYTVPPSALKKWVHGKGNADKDQMRAAIHRRWGVYFSDDNVADAYGLARYAAAFCADRAALSIECVQRAVQTPAPA